MGRKNHQEEYLNEVKNEIMKYKWYQSEIARKDLGKEAILDWINKFAKNHRKEFIDKKILEVENRLAIIKSSYNMPEGMPNIIDEIHDCLESVKDNLEIDSININ